MKKQNGGSGLRYVKNAISHKGSWNRFDRQGKMFNLINNVSDFQVPQNLIDAFHYHTERLSLHKNAYGIRDIAISGGEIVLQYGAALSLANTSKAASPRQLFALRDEFNRIDKLKIDAANLAQDMLDIVVGLDIPTDEKTRIQNAYLQKIGQYLGVS